jgi:hypothetical protein
MLIKKRLWSITMKKFKEIIRRYLNRNEDTLFSNNVIHEMNGVVLQKTNNAIFDFYGVMIDEVIAYCEEQGCKPDKIIFVSSYDIQTANYSKMRINMTADSNISIIEENDMIIARVCICEQIKMKENLGYGE